jgi:N-methylhydantoinase A/oxoprolinase/acetone carboxylase beta subunit
VTEERADAVVNDVGGNHHRSGHDPRPRLEHRGEARRWEASRAMWPSGDISTIALGGDSEVS